MHLALGVCRKNGNLIYDAENFVQLNMQKGFKTSATELVNPANIGLVSELI